MESLDLIDHIDLSGGLNTMAPVPQGQEEAELGGGGPGHDYAIVRYRIVDLGAYVPRGEQVEVGSWSEAESFDAAGDLKYHHFAFDRMIEDDTWIIH